MMKKTVIKRLEKLNAEHAALLVLGGTKTSQQVNRMDTIRKMKRSLAARLQVSRWFKNQGIQV
jgi:hypothetical protein